MARAHWKPHEKHGELTERGDLPDSVYAFPKQRKEPLTDESHVRNAIARFDQVRGVSDEDRDLAFANIKKAAKYYGVELSERNWKELGREPSTRRSAADRKKSGKKAAATRKKARHQHGVDTRAQTRRKAGRYDTKDGEEENAIINSQKEIFVSRSETRDSVFDLCYHSGVQGAYKSAGTSTNRSGPISA